ncbi:glycosyltransferase family 2 protein [Candidatus Gottesmanbacteria bacterium]|nr:glycosyltransferase family 2 protein [Candidatus Gottesmanbacteria bacterium]
MSKPSISAFFPCYNDANTIGDLVVKTNQILLKITKNYEIIVVNDGSRDNSLEILKQIQKTVKALKIVNHSKNRGYGGALQSGFKNAGKELIFYTDGDGQYDVSELPLLLSCLTDDIDVINGIKIDRQDNNLRVFLGNAYKSVIRNIFNPPIYDIDCDFRLIRNKFMKKIDLKINSGAVCLELVKKLQLSGAHFREVSIHHFPRRFGQSQFFKIKPLFQTFFDLFYLIKLLNV